MAATLAGPADGRRSPNGETAAEPARTRQQHQYARLGAGTAGSMALALIFYGGVAGAR